MNKILIFLIMTAFEMRAHAQVIIAQICTGIGDGAIFANHNSLKFKRINTWDHVFEKQNYVPLVVKAGAGIPSVQGGLEFQKDVNPQIFTYDNESIKIDRIYWGGFARYNTGDDGSTEMFIASIGVGKSFEDKSIQNSRIMEFNKIAREEYWDFSFAAGISVQVLEPIYVTAEVTTNYLHNNPFEKGARFDGYYQWRLGFQVGIAFYLEL